MLEGTSATSVKNSTLVVADKKYVINSSRERIWGCLTMALMRCIPFEGMEFASEKSFSALLRVRIGQITLPMHVNMDIVDTVEPEIMVTRLKTTGLKGLAHLNQKITFILTPIDKNKTEVACKLLAENMSLFLKTFLLWKAKSFARNTLDDVNRLLKEWTEPTE